MGHLISNPARYMGQLHWRNVKPPYIPRATRGGGGGGGSWGVILIGALDSRTGPVRDRYGNRGKPRLSSTSYSSS